MVALISINSCTAPGPLVCRFCNNDAKTCKSDV